MIASFFLSTWSGMATEDQVPLPTDNSHIRDLSSSMIPEAALPMILLSILKMLFFPLMTQTESNS